MKIIIKKVNMHVLVTTDTPASTAKARPAEPNCERRVIGPFSSKDLKAGESFPEFLARMIAAGTKQGAKDADKAAETPVQDADKAAAKDRHWNPAAEACGL